MTIINRFDNSDMSILNETIMKDTDLKKRSVLKRKSRKVTNQTQTIEEEVFKCNCQEKFNLERENVK